LIRSIIAASVVSSSASEVVRRDVGGHADGDTARAVGQQVGEPARQNRRLLHSAVVVRDEIDCLLVDFAQHVHGQRGEACFGVVADEPVGDERMVVGVHSQAVNRLHPGIVDRSHLSEVEPAIGQFGGDRSHVGVGDAAEDLLPVTAPPLNATDVVLLEPLFVDPTATAMSANEFREAGNAVGIRTAGLARHSPEHRAQLLLLRTSEADLGGEQFSLGAVGDDDLVLAGGVPVSAGDHPELQQHLLHIGCQPDAARGIRDLDGVPRQR
jgi:hypothetical protein